MKLNVSPLISLCDEKVSICISELPPFGKVKMKASVCIPWAKNVRLESTAFFTADNNGYIDISKQKPDSGDYDFIDGMGLISSVKLTEGRINDIGRNISVKDSMYVIITAECGQDQTSVKLERLFMSPDVKQERITNGFLGEFFCTDDPNNKTILLLGGSGGSLGANLPIASLLASHGFNVLTLAYFSEEGLPSKLSEIPLEYFEKAFAWLNNNRITTGKDIYLHCTSKGGELGLLLASRYPYIKKVAAFAPHAFCFQGIGFKNVSSWTYDGKQVPYIRLKAGILIANMLGCFIKNTPFGFTYTYKESLLKAKNKDDARIKVENAKADILLFAGKQDNIWNSYDGCVEIMDTLRKKSYQYEYQLYSYKNAGHPFYAPYIIPASESASMKMAPRMSLSSGGTFEGNAYAQTDSWEKALAFFKK